MKVIHLMIILASVSVASDLHAQDLKQISDAQLIEEYTTRGLAVPVTDQRFSTNRISKSWQAFREARAEVVRRGSGIIPELLTFLASEVPRQRTSKLFAKITPGFTGDLIGCLATIGDPRAGKLFLKILNGLDGKASSLHRRMALRGLERLTFCTFRNQEPNRNTYADTILHPGGIDGNAEDFLEIAAGLYEIWLKREGKNPSRWLPSARDRARRILASEDLSQIYCAVAFLQRYGRDDQPGRTLIRLAQIAQDFKKEGPEYKWKGKTIPVHIANWMNFLSHYGPGIRAHSKLLISIQKERGLMDWDGYKVLRRVGGKEIMKHLFDCLSRVKTVDAKRECRFGIDRWAGRRFKNDTERKRWWKENQHKNQEDWLKEGLPIVAAQSDAGTVWAHWIAEEMLPDLPGPSMIGWITQESPKKIGKKPVSRVKWLTQNKERLRYDWKIGGFGLPEK